MTSTGSSSSDLLHHVELWVPDLARAEQSWGWLLTARREEDGVLRGYDVELVAG